MRGEIKNKQSTASSIELKQEKSRVRRDERVEEIMAENGKLIVGLRVACAWGNLLSLLC